MKDNMIHVDLNSHMHVNWFEVKKDEQGTYIMCPEGCRRLLTKQGYVAEYNKKNDLWEKIS